jgi:WD40 repeat protein
MQEFIPQKPSCIKFFNTLNDVRIITGSLQQSINTLALWRYKKNDNGANLVPETVPKNYFHLDGSCSDIITFNDTIFAATTNGTLFSFATSREQKTNWKNLHVGNITSIDISNLQNPVVITAGEDSSVNLVNLGSEKIEEIKCDSLPILCVQFQSKFRENRFCTSSNSIKIWDLNAGKTPVHVLKDVSQNDINTFSIHPGQPDLIVSGSSNGVISLWDVKKPNIPVTKFVHQPTIIWKVAFNTQEPNKIYSCSENGYLLQWTFQGDFNLQPKVNILHQSLMSINSFDICSFNEETYIAACSDNGQIIVQ